TTIASGSPVKGSCFPTTLRTAATTDGADGFGATFFTTGFACFSTTVSARAFSGCRNGVVFTVTASTLAAAFFTGACVAGALCLGLGSGFFGAGFGAGTPTGGVSGVVVGGGLGGAGGG